MDQLTINFIITKGFWRIKRSMKYINNKNKHEIIIRIDKNEFIHLCDCYQEDNDRIFNVKIDDVAELCQFLKSKNVMFSLHCEDDVINYLLKQNRTDILEYGAFEDKSLLEELIYRACKISDLSTIEILFKHIPNEKYFRIFQWICIWYNRIDVVELFFEMFHNNEHFNEQVANKLKKNIFILEDLKLLQLFIKYGYDIYQHINFLMIYSIENNNIDIVKYIFDTYEYVPIINHSYLYCLANNHVKMLELLLDKSNGEYDITDNFFFLDMGECSVKMAQMLINNEVDLMKYRKKIIMEAREVGNHQLIQFLKTYED